LLRSCIFSSGVVRYNLEIKGSLRDQIRIHWWCFDRIFCRCQETAKNSDRNHGNYRERSSPTVCFPDLTKLRALSLSCTSERSGEENLYLLFILAQEPKPNSLMALTNRLTSCNTANKLQGYATEWENTHRFRPRHAPFRAPRDRRYRIGFGFRGSNELALRLPR
jgi:hypothetical protein